jgi:flagella basal body P-ring formation protein FlgA
MFALLLLLTANPNVEAQLERALPPHLALVEVEIPKHLPKNVELLATFRSEPKPGRSLITLLAVDAQGNKTKTWANVKLALRTTVWIAKHDLAEGTVISIANAEPKMVLAEKEVPQLQLGNPLLRARQSGETIGAEDVLLPPPLPRGTQLTIIAKIGAVEVSTSGTLERPARPGEIAVARISTVHRLIRGRLADRETLMVEGSSR